jgi:hypothetical protein
MTCLAVNRTASRLSPADLGAMQKKVSDVFVGE